MIRDALDEPEPSQIPAADKDPIPRLASANRPQPARPTTTNPAPRYEIWRSTSVKPRQQLTDFQEEPVKSDERPVRLLPDTVPVPPQLVAGTLVVEPKSSAAITGRIVLKGTPPREKELPLDPYCASMRTNRPTTRFYVVDATCGLADVLVYIKEGLVQRSFLPPRTPVVLDQIQCEFVPHVFAMQTRQGVLIRTSASMNHKMHNVRVTPGMAGNDEKSWFQGPGAQDLYVPRVPELFLRFASTDRPGAFAYAGVFDHPFFAVSGPDGTFRIPNVPPGNYVIEAAHRKAGKAAQTINVRDGDELDVNFVLKVPQQDQAAVVRLQ